MCCLFFFFNDTATTEIYTLSLHDALPISAPDEEVHAHINDLARPIGTNLYGRRMYEVLSAWERSEEHTSELQSRQYLVCRLLLEKKKKSNKDDIHNRV